jgi:hypothetical protein
MALKLVEGGPAAQLRLCVGACVRGGPNAPL